MSDFEKLEPNLTKKRTEIDITEKRLNKSFVSKKRTIFGRKCAAQWC